jgi:Domain of unknown function (DUF4118)
LAITVLCTAVAWQLPSDFGLVNIVMIYLLGVTLGALRLGRGPIVALAISNMLAFDYFFVPPVFSFDVEDIRYLFTLGVMLIVALVIANLMVSIRSHREVADARESHGGGGGSAHLRGVPQHGGRAHGGCARNPNADLDHRLCGAAFIAALRPGAGAEGGRPG